MIRPRILGVPLHPALVHFPIVLWTAAPIAQAIFLATGSVDAWRLGYWSVLLGVGSGAFAAVFGLLDATDKAALPLDSAAWRLAQSHMRWMTTAWACFAIELTVMVPRPPHAGTAWLVLLVSLAGFSGMLWGAHQAGRLVHGPERMHGQEPRRHAS